MMQLRSPPMSKAMFDLCARVIIAGGLPWAMTFLFLTCLLVTVRAAPNRPSTRAIGVDTPIIFTSRAGSASFIPVPPPPDERYPGGLFPRSPPGKLRLRTSAGALIELTWKKRLPDGSTLVDVMSPSVSPDAGKVIFAGIKNTSDHFRIYEVKLDGSGLKQLTGQSGDTGCVEPPYLRLGPSGQRMADAVRRRIDYDDLDPAYLADGRIVFSSTRLPRKALYGNHRVTNLWVMNSDGSGKHQITYNLAGERWPYVLKDGRILYSYWSRTLSRAAANAVLSGRDERDLEAKAARLGKKLLTSALPNSWWPAVVNPDGTDFCALSKPQHAALHTRPLFNGNLVYARQQQNASSLTPFNSALEQVPAGYIGLASGGRIGSDEEFPSIENGIVAGPGAFSMQEGQEAGNGLAPRAVSPSPLPGGQVIFSYADGPQQTKSDKRCSYDYGLYAASDDWSSALDNLKKKAEADQSSGSDRLKWTAVRSAEFQRLIGLRRIFDEPGMVEGDAQAVYRRKCLVRSDQTRKQLATLRLASGRQYCGPVGGVSSPDVYANSVLTAPGQRTDSGESPVFTAPPRGLIKAIEFYAATMGRDKNGLATGELRLEAVVEAEVSASGGFAVTVPAGKPLMQFGKDAQGNLATWSAQARDSRGKTARLSAFAGDHFGYAPEGVPRSFCVGCHAGHTVLPGRDLADLIPAR